VDVRIGQRAVRFARNGDGYVVTTSEGGTAHGDVVLVALGRRAPTDDIDIEIVGLNPVATSRSTGTCACAASRGCTR
jgi:pyruvate/2-oxoglutarate dehydrogenase complex dihydrolipoamide dehydrogenase (E3) component